MSSECNSTPHQPPNRLFRVLVLTFALAMLTLLTNAVAQDNAAPGAAPATCVPPAASSISVPLLRQEARYWCWAASAQMIMKYLGKTVAQCTQANDEFHQTDCCQSPNSDRCNKGGWPEFSKHGISSHITQDAPLSWTAVKAQLAPRDPKNPCSFTPFAFSWHWTNGGGHMMVAIGYRTVNGVNYVIVNDPMALYGPAMTYDEYAGATDDHTHWNDYYDIEPR